MQFLPINIHHRMMMRKQQHALAVFQQRPHKLAHKRRFGNARGLAFFQRNLIHQQRARRGRHVAVRAQQAQLFKHRLHQPAVNHIVRVNLLHQPAFFGKLGQHLGLGAAQHQPLSAQMLAQQVRLDDHVIAIAIAPFAGKGLPIPQEVIIQNVDHIPDFAALIVDRRAGQTDHTLAAFG